MEHLAHTLASVPWGFECEVLIETTLAEARSWIPASIANLEETEGGVVLRTQGDSLRAAARSLVRISMDIDCAFAVIRPPELREEVRRLARELLVVANRTVPEHPANA